MMNTRSVIGMFCTVFVLCAVVVLVGCASRVPQSYQVTMETPSREESIVYFINNLSDNEPIFTGDFFENDRVVSVPDGARYFAIHTEPGEKVIRHKNEAEGEVCFLAEPGKRYFIYRERFMVHVTAAGLIPALVLRSATSSYQIYEIDEENAIAMLRGLEWKNAKK